MHIPELNPTELKAAIRAAFTLDKAVMVWSSPGKGKSQIIRQLADEDSAVLCDPRVSTWDAVDGRGVPATRGDWTKWLPPEVLPFEGNPNFPTDRPIILFLDEILQAGPSVQSVCFQLTLDKALGEHKLMPNVQVIAASNRQGDRGGAQRMATPLANRFIHLGLATSVAEWCEWAWSCDLDPRLVAYIRLCPDQIDTFDPSSGEVAFSTPRSLETAAHILGLNLQPALRFKMLSGTIGPGVATGLEAFLRVWDRLPSIDGIRLNPDTAPVPTALDELTAITAAIAKASDKKSFDAFSRYLLRLPDTFAVMATRFAAARCPEVQLTAGFAKLAHKFKHIWED